jgi:hypothetical protein
MSSIGVGQMFAAITDGLLPGVPAAFAVRAVDIYGNVGALSNLGIGVLGGNGMLTTAPARGCGCHSTHARTSDLSPALALAIALVLLRAIRSRSGPTSNFDRKYERSV